MGAQFLFNPFSGAPIILFTYASRIHESKEKARLVRKEKKQRPLPVPLALKYQLQNSEPEVGKTIRGV